VVPCPGARDEQDAPLALQILSVSERVLAGGSQRGERGHRALLHADDGDGLELQALHSVHGPGADPVLRALRRQREGGNARGLERIAGLMGQAGGPGGYADGMGLDTGVQPGEYAFCQFGQFLLAGGCGADQRAAAAHGRAVAGQGVRVADFREQPLIIGLGDGLQRGLQLLQRFLVADLENSECLVDAEPVTGGVGVGLVMGQDRDQAVGVARRRGEDDAAPEAVDPDRPDAVVAAVQRAAGGKQQPAVSRRPVCCWPSP